MTARTDIHQEITDRILQDMEKATAGSWSLPWYTAASSAMPSNIDSGKAYQGINTLVLWSSAMAQQFPSNVWGTFKQFKAKGGSVRKGEKGTRVIFYKLIPAKEGAEDQRPFPMLKSYTVFNIAQTEGVEDLSPSDERPEDLGADPIHAADQFIKATQANIREGHGGAYYHPASDTINMPPAADFYDTEGYYGTLLHELTHWTGNKRRLDRLKSAGFGSPAYAKEELIAELGAAFLCAQLGITAAPREDHAQYLKSWIKVLRDDKKAIFTAAAAASKAVNFLNDLQPKAQQDADNASAA